MDERSEDKGGENEPLVCDACSGKDIYAKRPRHEMLSGLVVGDVFHARHPDSEASLICMVTAIDGSTIQARRMIVPKSYAFDRKTGVEQREGGATIDSVEPLPVDVFSQILWLDRKNRLGWDLRKAKLSDAEKQALLYVSRHYEDNQLEPIPLSPHELAGRGG